MTRGTGALWFGLALLWCVQAAAQEPSADRSRRERADSAEEAEVEGESSSDRRKRRREERARRKAEEAAAQAAAQTGGDSASSGSVKAPEAPTGKRGKAKTAAVAAPVEAPVAALPATTTPEPVESPPVVYVPRVEPGPPPYTMVELLEGEGALDPRRLPAPSALDLTQVLPEQLRKLDGRLTVTLEEMQAGDSCEALRTASRVPLRSWITREHQRELMVVTGLFVMALVMAFGFRSPAMRALMPIVPFVACLYVGYDMVQRVDDRIEGIAQGLRACSASLKEGSAEKPQVVREHLDRVMRVRDHINLAYERENGLVARVMDDYRM
jgi:hypothetical protein